jgi:hypothetical protein
MPSVAVTARKAQEIVRAEPTFIVFVLGPGSTEARRIPSGFRFRGMVLIGEGAGADDHRGPVGDAADGLRCAAQQDRVAGL